MPEYKNTEDAKKNTPDMEVTGDPDVWSLVCKVSSIPSRGRGFVKSTKVGVFAGRTVLQTETEHYYDGVLTACSQGLAPLSGDE